MKKLLLPVLSVLLCLNLLADDTLETPDPEYIGSMQLMAKHQLLDEIERLKGEIDELTQVGRISSSTALAVSAALSTIGKFSKSTGKR